MHKDLNNPLKVLSSIILIGILMACGSGGGAYEPNYTEERLLDGKRRINGELPFSSPSLMKMAKTFRAAGDYSNAIRLYQRAANESPNHVTSRLALGQIYQRLGAYDGALIFYKQVLALEPDNKDASLALGQVMVLNNQPVEAISYLEEYAEKNPSNFRIYSSIGLAYDLQGQHEEAQNAYSTGLNIRPNHVSLINNLALSLAFEDEYLPAIQLLEKAINLDHSQTTAQLNLIMVFTLYGDEQAARTMATSLMTSEEVEASIDHYRWIETLSSERRAKAIFLNLTSFPDEDAAVQNATSGLTTEATVTRPQISNDPKKQMLFDILRADENTTVPTPINKIEFTVEEEITAYIAPIGVLNNKIKLDPEEMISTETFKQKPAINYHLQIGSYTSATDVIMNWEKYRKLAPTLLNDTQINVREIKTANDRKRYRLFIGSYDNINAANEFCIALKDKNIPCSAMKNEDS